MVSCERCPRTVFGNPLGDTTATQTTAAMHTFQADEVDMTEPLMDL